MNLNLIARQPAPLNNSVIKAYSTPGLLRQDLSAFIIVGAGHPVDADGPSFDSASRAQADKCQKVCFTLLVINQASFKFFNIWFFSNVDGIEPDRNTRSAVPATAVVNTR